MKRTSLVVIALLMVCFLPPARAQTVSVGSVSVQCGQSVQVPVSIDSVSGLLAVQFEIAYDAATLQASNVVAGSLTSGFSIASNISGGVVKVALASGSPISGSGTVAVFTVSVAGSAAPGSSTLSISKVLVNDVAKNGSDGSVSISCLQAPSPPSYIAPANGATGVPAPVRLSWNASAGASAYRVNFGTSGPAFLTTTSATFADVDTATGTSYSWNVEAINDAGSSGAGPTWSFTTAGPHCNTPAAPAITAPAAATSGTSYDVTWNAVADASDYVLEEATSTSFANATSTTTTALKQTFTKTVTADTTYYYRIRARNNAGGCTVNGPISATGSVKVSPKPPIPVGGAVLPAVGSTPGQGGAMFRTSMQLFNPTSGTISGRIVYHPAGSLGGATDPFLPFTLAPGETISYLDLLPAMGITSGLGSVDLVPSAGSTLPLFVTRVYNDAGVNGTSGMTLEALSLDDALFAGQMGYIIAPMDPAKARLNIGIRSLGDGASFTVTMRDKKGVTVAAKPLSYGPTFFLQTSAENLMGVPLSGDATLCFAMTTGSAIIYGSSTDNTTQDTSVQIARPIH